MSEKTKISVIVPTYNRKGLLQRCLKSLFEQSYSAKEYEIVVADDGSSDGTGDFVKSLKPKCRLVYVWQENKGRGPARNFGVANSSGEILAFTDDDCIVDRDWIKNAIKGFTYEKIGGMRGRTITDSKEITPLSRPVISEGGDQTCNIFYKREAFNKVGGFKLSQFREDTDLAFRVRDAGYEMPYNSKVIVKHPADKYTLGKLFKKHIGLQKGYWDMYIAKHYPGRFKKEIAIAGVFSPDIFMNYPFYLSFAFSMFALLFLSTGVFITSIILLAYVYFSSVLMITNELCRSTTFRQMAKYKGELLQIFAVWWVLMFIDLWFHVKGMVKFGVFIL